MRQFTAREMAAFDISTLSQEERTRFCREAIRSAHAARSEAVQRLFLDAAERLERYPLMMRALVDSAAVLIMIIALSATMSEAVATRMVSASIGPVSAGLPLLW